VEIDVSTTNYIKVTGCISVIRNGERVDLVCYGESDGEESWINRVSVDDGIDQTWDGALSAEEKSEAHYELNLVAGDALERRRRQLQEDREDRIYGHV
jgi:hypothetical protein